ncbi:MAG: MFS transporter [Candidatus Lokiarchaeota archaeon]|nr:MFS transporter [Candidatus Lokiarchaeota archaeon]
MVSSKSTPQTGVKISFGRIVAWGIASLGLSTISGVYGALLSIFYNDFLGLVDRGPWIVVVVSIAYAVWNALNDGIFGFISDSTKSKKGRRIPYMRWTSPFLALSFALVWLAQSSWGIWAIFVWMLFTMLFYDTAYTIIGLVYSALLPEVTENEKQRHRLQLSASFFGLVGTILGFLLPMMFQTDSTMLRIVMATVGVIGSLMVFLTTFFFKERPEFSQVDEPLKLKDSIKHTFKSKSFVVLVTANFMSIFMQATLLSSVIYVATYVTNDVFSDILLLVSIFVPLILGIFLTPLISKKLGVVGADQLLLTFAGIGLILITFLPTQFIVIGYALAGFGLTGPQVFTNIMFAQVSDEDEIVTGVRREAAFFGTNALITKPAQSLSLIMITLMLRYSGFKERIGTLIFNGPIDSVLGQPSGAILAIKLFSGLVPGVLMIIEVLILFVYPLKGKRLATLEQKILILHDEKHKKLNEMSRE